MTDDSPQAIEEFKQLMADPSARAAFVELKRQKAREGVRMRYEHVFNAVFSMPWAMLRSYMPIVADVLVERMQGQQLSVEDLERIEAARRPARQQAPQGVAVIPIHGVIVPKASLFSDVSGATSIEGLRSMFRDAMAASDVGAIVFDVDSPGGSATGVPEMAAEIRGARGRKPMVSVATGLAASAAYWLAAQADEFTATRSSMVGSIGVITAHEDISKALEDKGIKITTITGGEHKDEMSPFKALSDDARAHVESLVADMYAMFVNDVARARGVGVEAVRSETFGQGRVYLAAEGVKRGMVDRIASLEEVVGERFAELQRAKPAAAAATDELVAAVRAGAADTELAEALYFTAAAGTEPQPLVAAVDDSDWDGNRAMGQCSSASDYRSICAGEHTTGEPDERQHWALPHHYLGRGPNRNGVNNALSRIPQTQDLKDRDKAQTHLDGHKREMGSSASATDDFGEEIALLRHTPVPRDPLSR